MRATPGARRPGVSVETGPDGALRVAVKVTEPAAEGRANAAVLRALAKALGVAPSALTLERGAASRDKLVRILG